ncbi:hypothetical protein S2091_4289 [Solimicrobium silvestre]|uniref:Uncharacterized protein n=1 Tax=Solimicrobium silvestre TaxID=2099400 RepID=A0A2S9GTF5_9BURK|nr:hypothetical protein S2091_4289 [Solimicrobium silvestre]
METTLHPGHKAPDFDTKITDFINTYDHYPWPSPPRYIGIAMIVDGSYVAYRTVEAMGMPEALDMLGFLHSIGMRDMIDSIPKKGKFDGIFGFPMDLAN